MRAPCSCWSATRWAARGLRRHGAVLADHYTVVTYDPRGFARSTIEDRDQDGEPDLLADDVRRLIEAVGDGPAHVFGSSGGAVTGLAWRPASPAACEPSWPMSPRSPCSCPVPMRPPLGYRSLRHLPSKARRGWARFSTFTGMDLRPPRAEAAPESRRPGCWRRASVSSVTACSRSRCTSPTSPPWRTPRPGWSSPGGPHRGASSPAHGCALADRLGTPLIDFPGGHGGFASDPEDFATVLRRTLAEAVEMG